ncbi:MAG: TIGR01906 family membrane protein [Oscillibacter sp.]|nr:TIGR01906 family membrane protein [Oscillibacter sp.]
MKQSKILTVILASAVALLVLSSSIAVPILCRPFYYAHIDAFGLEEYTGLEEVYIRQAYDEMMDFCIGLSDEFSTGILRWSESGKSHFVDVKGLFLLDLALLGISVAVLIADVVLRSRRKVQPYRFLDRGPGFWAAVGLGGVFSVIALLVSIDFSRAFVIFHTLFFPGKDNWIFDWRTDPIILILPEEFFRNCAILIVALLLVWCIVLVAVDLWVGKMLRPRCGGFTPKK